ncbi:MAG: YIP1 family protein [Caldilineaceae bacterium]
MSLNTFIPIPQKSTSHAVWSRYGWLPAWPQVRTAVMLRVNEVAGEYEAEQAETADLRTTSMRQGIGLVFVAGLVGGLLPFLVNWVTAARMGTALPLAQLARYAEQQGATTTSSPWLQVWTDSARTLAGLTPILPGWLAAGLSALGAWVNTPLQWLTVWLVYGLGVLLVAKLLGAGATLQRFYAATSYAFVPLMLLTLRPIPYLGPLALLVGVLWAIALYAHAVHSVTYLPIRAVALALGAPLGVGLLLILIVLSVLALVFLPLWV